MERIDIMERFGNSLLTLENPARYVGGEYTYGKGQGIGTAKVLVGICFPDLYEIGMSNNAVRILLDLVARMGGEVAADRVFSVAPDFERFLREHDVPLHTLDHGIPLRELDLLGISIGYELAATNILQVLDLGRIPFHASLRGDEDPIVIAGGPAITNPLPFAPFFDFVFIGEAEAGLEDVILTIKEAKRQGLGRSQIIGELAKFPYLWHPGKPLAIRAIDDDFTCSERSRFIRYVVPHFKVAQDNGVVESCAGVERVPLLPRRTILQALSAKNTWGCPSARRQYVREFGYREITLSSLSSGDHPLIKPMIEQLNTSFANDHIPSRCRH